MSTHRLSVIISQTEEKFLGDYTNFYEAVEAAESTFREHNAFRISNGLKSIIGTRMIASDVFWRIPRSKKTRGRDWKIWNVFNQIFL